MANLLVAAATTSNIAAATATHKHQGHKILQSTSNSFLVQVDSDFIKQSTYFKSIFSCPRAIVIDIYVLPVYIFVDKNLTLHV